MIKGIGVDIVSIEFVSKMFDRFGEQFLFTYYSEKEISFFNIKKRNSMHFLAGRFAVKEAFYKAISSLGVEGGEDLDFKDIEVLNDEKGSPFISFICQVPKGFDEIISKIHVSISHHGDYAVAAVIAENTNS